MLTYGKKFWTDFYTALASFGGLRCLVTLTLLKMKRQTGLLSEAGNCLPCTIQCIGLCATVSPRLAPPRHPEYALTPPQARTCAWKSPHSWSKMM